MYIPKTAEKLRVTGQVNEKVNERNKHSCKYI